MRIPDLDEIEGFVEESKLREALEDLAMICEIADQPELRTNVISLKARLSKNNRDDRNGTISRDAFYREEAIIRQAILGIHQELETVEGIGPMIRRNIKRMIYERSKSFDYLYIDFEQVTGEEKGQIKFSLDEFEDTSDFLNGIFLKMANYVPPYSYGQAWRLINTDGNDALQQIQAIFTAERQLPTQQYLFTVVKLP